MKRPRRGEGHGDKGLPCCGSSEDGKLGQLSEEATKGLRSSSAGGEVRKVVPTGDERGMRLRCALDEGLGPL